MLHLASPEWRKMIQFNVKSAHKSHSTSLNMQTEFTETLYRIWVWLYVESFKKHINEHCIAFPGGLIWKDLMPCTLYHEIHEN